jgi:hypothetical protein
MDDDYKNIVAAILAAGMTGHMNLPTQLPGDRAALESVRLFHTVREMLGKTKDEIFNVR